MEEGSKKFNVKLSVDIEIRVSKQLLASVLTEEWRKDHYSFTSEADVAEHLAFNLLQGTSLTRLDGFADQPARSATLARVWWDVEEVSECEADSPDHGGDR